jgi:manganese transport protein
VFIISGLIMAVSTGALFYKSKQVTEVIDMVNTLEPIAGKFAQTLFFFGTLSLSKILFNPHKTWQWGPLGGI